MKKLEKIINILFIIKLVFVFVVGLSGYFASSPHLPYQNHKGLYITLPIALLFLPVFILERKEAILKIKLNKPIEWFLDSFLYMIYFIVCGATFNFFFDISKKINVTIFLICTIILPIIIEIILEKKFRAEETQKNEILKNIRTAKRIRIQNEQNK